MVQFPGPSRREEQEFAGLISGTEWERGAGASQFDSRHQTNTILSVLKNTEGEGTYFALLTARPSHDHKDNAVPSQGKRRNYFIIIIIIIITIITIIIIIIIIITSNKDQITSYGKSKRA